MRWFWFVVVLLMVAAQAAAIGMHVGARHCYERPDWCRDHYRWTFPR